MCWEGEHVGVGVLAAVLFVCYLSGYPVGSYARLRTIHDDLDKSAERKVIWADFIYDYRPNRFWFLHVRWLLAFAILAANEFLDPSPIRSALIITMCVAFSAALMVLSPFQAHMRWKLPVRLGLVVCTILSEVLELTLAVTSGSENTAVTQHLLQGSFLAGW